MEKQKLLEIIVPIVASGVLSGTVLNGIVTHILYNKKLKKEQRIKFENMIGGQDCRCIIVRERIDEKIKCHRNIRY